MNKKNKHLDCYTDNLAFPEVHVEDVKTENDENENNSESGVIFDNLAIPEIKSPRKGKDNKKTIFCLFSENRFFYFILEIYSLISFSTRTTSS